MYFKKLLTILFLILSSSLFAAEYKGIDFSIGYYNKKIYYPGDTVQIKASILNNSSNDFSFELSDNKIHNISLSVRTMKNRLLDPSESYIMGKSKNGNTFYRPITLSPGEAFSFIVEISSFADLGEAGMYILDGRFIVDLNDPQNSPLLSNRLPLSIRPRRNSGEENIMIEYKTGEILKAYPIPPDETVSYTLRARQKEQWEKFFLYLNLKELMFMDENKKREFERASEAQQQLLLKKFSSDLQNRRLQSDQSIVIIPSDFEILHTSYSSEKATVIVREEFLQAGYTAVKSYTYYLHRRGGVWKIYNYEVKNIGTK